MTPQLTPTDADIAGVSIVSGTNLSADRGLYGNIYSPQGLACGELIHAHRLIDGKYLLAYATTWTAATPDGAGGYSSKTVVPGLSTFYKVDPNDGNLVPVQDRSGLPGVMSVSSGDPAPYRLAGGASSGTKVFYLRGDGTTRTITCYDTVRDVEFQWEIVLPAVNIESDTVRWNRGLFVDQGNLCVIGSRVSDNALYLMCIPLSSPQNMTSWSYANSRGWTTNSQELSPLKSESGNPITTVTNVTVAIYRTTLIMSTTAVVGSQALGQIWTTFRAPFGVWVPNNTQVPLGEVSALLGSGVCLQRELHANPDHTMLQSDKVSAGVPYCWSTPTANLITTRWNVWPIPKLGT